MRGGPTKVPQRAAHASYLLPAAHDGRHAKPVKPNGAPTPLSSSHALASSSSGTLTCVQNGSQQLRRPPPLPLFRLPPPRRDHCLAHCTTPYRRSSLCTAQASSAEPLALRCSPSEAYRRPSPRIGSMASATCVRLVAPGGVVATSAIMPWASVIYRCSMLKFLAL